MTRGYSIRVRRWEPLPASARVTCPPMRALVRLGQPPGWQRRDGGSCQEFANNGCWHVAVITEVSPNAAISRRGTPNADTPLVRQAREAAEAHAAYAATVNAWHQDYAQQDGNVFAPARRAVTAQGQRSSTASRYFRSHRAATREYRSGCLNAISAVRAKTSVGRGISVRSVASATVRLPCSIALWKIVLGRCIRSY
jgi:hypothetical protein